MTDAWVRSPDQQALIDAQAVVDAQSRPDIVVRRYPGVPQAAVADFKADAARMTSAGWQPVSVAYATVPLDRATILSLGALSIAAPPGGSLFATYRYLRPGSDPGPDAPEPEQEGGPIDANPESTGPG